MTNGRITAREWREALEAALGLEPDPENHTPQWAFDVVRKIREIGNRQRTAWFVYDPEDGLDRYQTADEAKARAEQIMEEESDRAASDGWREDIESLEWGELISHGRACCIKSEKAPEGSDFDEIQEWGLR